MKILKVCQLVIFLFINSVITNAQNTISQVAPTYGNNTIPDPANISGIYIGNGGSTLFHGNNTNIAIGNNALSAVTSGNSNTAIGFSALSSVKANNSSTAVGYMALANFVSGTNNTAVGALALQSDTSGFHNVAVGQSALKSNVSGNYNNAFGHLALRDNTASLNNAFGFEALRSNQGGASNAAFGSYALSNNISGGGNSAFGNFSLQNNNDPIANGNSAFGASSLYFNKTGANNTAAGNFALNKNIAGNNNTALGNYALSDATGSNNLGIGNSSQVPVSTANNQLSIQNAIYGINMNFATTADIGIGIMPTAYAGTNFARLYIAGNPSTAPSLQLQGVPTTPNTGSNYLYVDANGVVRQSVPTGTGTGISSTCTSIGKVPFTTSIGGNLDCSNIFYDPSTVFTGIGTITPTATLHVNGTVRFENLPVNPQNLSPDGTLPIVLIDPNTGNLYQSAINKQLRPAINNNNEIDSLTAQINDLKTQVNKLSSMVELIMTNSSNSISNKFFNIYPNPAKNQIIIQPTIIANNMAQYVEIRDISNKTVVSKMAFNGYANLDLKNIISSGTYIVIIFQNDKIVQTEKINIIR